VSPFLLDKDVALFPEVVEHADDSAFRQVQIVCYVPYRGISVANQVKKHSPMSG
jgi:hypothetical protein